MTSALVIVLTALLMMAGLVGSILPLLPGTPLIFLGALLYAWHTDFRAIHWNVLIGLGFLTIFSQIFDYLASLYGAKRFGASYWGMLGAFLGGVLGTIMGGIGGALVGPILGAILFEWLRGAALGQSMKIGMGTFIGLIGGTIGKLLIAIMMIGIFLGSILWGR